MTTKTKEKTKKQTKQKPLQRIRTGTATSSPDYSRTPRQISFTFYRGLRLELTAFEKSL
jgi:hypothetical protein